MLWDVDGGGGCTLPSTGTLAVNVALGRFNRMGHVTGIHDYWMDVDFTATLFMWANGDERYCPRRVGGRGGLRDG